MMKKPVAIVSDHALLRYLERVMHIDIGAIRNEIGHKVDRAVERGASGVVVDGFVFKLEGERVTTILYASTPDIRLGRKRRKP